MPKVILDTDILSEIIKERDPVVLANAASYLVREPALSFTSVSVVEVLSGLYVKDARKQLAKAEAFFGFHEQILPTEQDYRLTARILADLTLAGQQIGWDDPVIAACAINRGVPIATGNTRHYQRIIDLGYGLVLGNWREA